MTLQQQVRELVEQAERASWGLAKVSAHLQELTRKARELATDAAAPTR